MVGNNDLKLVRTCSCVSWVIFSMIHVCIYICRIYIYTYGLRRDRNPCVFTHFSSIFFRLWVYLRSRHVHIHIHIHTEIHAYMHTYIHTYIHTYWLTSTPPFWGSLRPLIQNGRERDRGRLKASKTAYLLFTCIKTDPIALEVSARCRKHGTHPSWVGCQPSCYSPWRKINLSFSL